VTAFARLDDRCKEKGLEVRILRVGGDDMELRVWSPKLKKYLAKAKFDPAKPDAAAQKAAEQLLLTDGV
jgi:hypothetical protein